MVESGKCEWFVCVCKLNVQQLFAINYQLKKSPPKNHQILDKNHQNKNFNSCIFDLSLKLGTRPVWVLQMEIKGVA